MKINTIKLGSNVWMAQNLDVKVFADGSIIIEAQTREQWEQAIIDKKPAWCYYKADEAMGNKYGLLYNEYVVRSGKELLTGWRVPDNNDWQNIITLCGGQNKAGTLLKSEKGWKNKGNGIGSTGFDALPGGGRFDNSVFLAEKQRAHFWSRSVLDENKQQFVFMNYLSGVAKLLGDENRGYSIRLVR